jgi:FMN phosphatase YigB (HAD superfamily)
MAIRAVVFDVGGVLELSADDYPFDEWAASAGLTVEEFTERTADLWAAGGTGALSLAEVHRQLAERLGIGPGKVDEIMEQMWQVYLGTANTELIEWARTLRPAYRTGILSNSFVGAREREHAAYGYGDVVDDLVYSHEVGMVKPEPRIYALACSRLGVSPGAAVLLDDREPFVAGARGAGMHAVWFRGDNALAIAEITGLLSRLYGLGDRQRSLGALPEGSACRRNLGDGKGRRSDDSRTYPAAQRRHEHPDARPGRVAGAGRQGDRERGAVGTRAGLPAH